MKFTSTDINKNNTWQIGTGDDTRSYFEVFKKFGVALVGPGDPGPERDPGTIIYYSRNPSVSNYGAILKQVKKGEWIIARKGIQTIEAIGQVTNEYEYSHQFCDVDGWDLQHFVKVEWYLPVDGPIMLTDVQLGYKSISGCNQLSVFNKLYEVEFSKFESKFNVSGGPNSDPTTLLDIFDPLIENGTRIQDAENINNAINRIIRLSKWYTENDSDASEAEIVSFLVLPLIISLGWSEQKLKIEYNSIDVAIFDKPFIGDYKENPKIILEVKKFHNGLAFTNEQVMRYGKNYPFCNKYITTNGFRYKYYKRDNDGLKLVGYFNLLRYIEMNPVYDISISATETILSMSNFI